MLDRDLLARFLAAPLDDEVRRWALGALLSHMSRAERRQVRDIFLRSADAFLEGAPWIRARHIHELASEIAREMPAAPDTGTLQGLVASALLCDPGHVSSVKTISRAVDRTRSVRRRRSQKHA